MNTKSLLMCASAFFLFGCSLSGADETQTAQTTSAQKTCQEPEFRQLDFWVGTWDLEWDLPVGKKGTGVNIISNSPYGDCVITENFDGAPSMQFKGMSVSTYHKPLKQWRQTWVDDQGGYFALSGGPNADGTFALVNTRLGDKGPHLRMVWMDIKKDNLTWRWQGKKTAEGAWADRWVIRYTRRK